MTQSGIFPRILRGMWECAPHDPGTALMAMAATSTVLSAAGQAQAGAAANAQDQGQAQAQDYQAAELTQQAGQTRAVAESQEQDSLRKTAYQLSTARAVAASSGAGATDPTVVGIEGQIGAKGNFDALSQMYSGEEKARGLETQSTLDTYQGQQLRIAGAQKQKAGNIGAITTLLSGGNTLASKYGGTDGLMLPGSAGTYDTFNNPGTAGINWNGPDAFASPRDFE